MAYSKLKLVGKKISPYLWNSLAVSGLFAAADLSQQALEERDKKFNYDSAGRMAIVGAVHGPLSYTWHKRLEAVLPGTAFRTIVTKVFLTTSIAGGFFTFLFYTGKYPATTKKKKINKMILFYLKGMCLHQY